MGSSQASCALASGSSVGRSGINAQAHATGPSSQARHSYIEAGHVGRGGLGDTSDTHRHTDRAAPSGYAVMHVYAVACKRASTSLRWPRALVRFLRAACARSESLP